MNTFQKFLLSEEEEDEKRIAVNSKAAELLKQHGYGDPQSGADSHYTFAKGNVAVLVDMPDNEWHHVVDGVVKEVGKVDDDSLAAFLK